MQQDPAILLDQSTPFDQTKLTVLENVIGILYSGAKASDTQIANSILNQFKQNPVAYTFTDNILEYAQNVNTKFFALQILDEAVNQRWNIMPEEQKSGIRQFMIMKVLKYSEDEAIQQQNQHLLTKLNTTLVSIVKQEWTTTWKNFIPDICANAKESQSRCENVLSILKLLSEEVFDFSKNSMMSTSVNQLKESMSHEFGVIYELCMWLLQHALTNSQSTKPSLVRNCLKTLQAFLGWIPFAYIFETQMVEIILNNYITPSSTRIEAIKVFTEISSLDLKDQDEGDQIRMKERLFMLFCIFIQKIAEVTKQRPLDEEYKQVLNTKNQSGFENMAKQIALAISALIKNNIDLIEQTTNTMEPNQNILYLQQCFQKSLEFMVQLSNVQEDELFKICLDFWHFFSLNVMDKTKGAQYYSKQAQFGGMNFAGLMDNSFMHTQVYPLILETIRNIMIDNMARPKEVLVIIDENGEVVEQAFDDTETISIYEMMRETLIYLTNINCQAMDRVIQSRLDKLTGDKTYFSFDRLNKLCWALGSISGCMSTEDENKFVVIVIKELLNLCEKTSGKNNKALVAADIMYVVGQFPRFLCSHWPFLKTVIKKLNEFMHEKHPGVQDMASETFLKISKLTKQMFVQKNDSESMPYVNELIRQIPDNLKDLEINQKLQVYEGIGHMISCEVNPMAQEALVQSVLQYAHADWERIMQMANINVQALLNHDIIKSLDIVIKINTKIAESVGYMYLSYLRRIFPDLLRLYGMYSQQISEAVKFKGADQHMVKPMKTFRKDTLNLIQVYIERANEFSIFNQEFLPTLKSLVDDYQSSDPNARDSEVMKLFATMLKKMGDNLSGFLQQILYTLCQTTLAMIQDDYISNPDFRDAFFILIQNIVQYCASGLFQLEADKFSTIILSVLFAMKHEKPEIMEIGLNTMFALNMTVASEPQIASIFYQNFFTLIIKDTLAVITDYRHMSGFKLQAQILQQLIQIVESGLIQTNIFMDGSNPHQFPSNREFVIGLLIECISSLFPNLNRVQIETFVLNLFNNCADWHLFKTTLRDLLISMKSFSSNNDDFYQEEKNAAMDKIKEKRSAIPGMIKPGEQ